VTLKPTQKVASSTLTADAASANANTADDAVVSAVVPAVAAASVTEGTAAAAAADSSNFRLFEEVVSSPMVFAWCGYIHTMAYI